MRSVSITRAYRTEVLAWLHLAQVYNSLESLHQEILSPLGLTSARFEVLSSVASQPGLSQQELANRLRVTKGNVCGLLDRMEGAGWVERRPHPEDRRINRVFLTEEGEALFRGSWPELDRGLAGAFAGLEEEERKELMKLLAKLDRQLGDG